MDKNTHNPWALFPVRGWKEASNTLDTLLYRELTQAEQRRREKNESLLLSAQTIYTNIRHSMNCLVKNEHQKFGIQNADPELMLVSNICKILDLPVESIAQIYPNRAAV